MSNYEKPIVLANSELSEGVYAASGYQGTGNYNVTANIHQRPETGRQDYRIQVDANYTSDGEKGNGQILTVTFNKPVTGVTCPAGGTVIQGAGNTIIIQYDKTPNNNENIGFGDLIVTSDDMQDLAITSAAMTGK